MNQSKLFDVAKVAMVAPVEVTLDDIRQAAPRYLVRTIPNEYMGKLDEYNTWASSIECGRSYLVGKTVAMADFLKQYTSSLTSWQVLAYHWCRQNPARCLVLENSCFFWKVRQRGECIEFYLPHQEHGGEKAYVSHDGKTKVKVDDD